MAEETNGVVLCLDDDPDMLDTYQTVLEAWGYQPVLVESAEEGLRAFKENRPDVVLADLMMEEVDAGTNFVKEVRAMGGEDVPVYMISSVGDALSLEADYSNLGLKGVLQKPVNFDNLKRLIDKAVSG